jgi:hypothetical protein
MREAEVILDMKEKVGEKRLKREKIYAEKGSWPARPNSKA